MPDDTPIGFAMTMALNEAARDRFAAMPYEQRRQLEEEAGKVSSKREMEAFVRKIAEGTVPKSGSLKEK